MRSRSAVVELAENRVASGYSDSERGPVPAGDAPLLRAQYAKNTRNGLGHSGARRNELSLPRPGSQRSDCALSERLRGSRLPGRDHPGHQCDDLLSLADCYSGQAISLVVRSVLEQYPGSATPTASGSVRTRRSPTTTRAYATTTSGSPCTTAFSAAWKSRGRQLEPLV